VSRVGTTGPAPIFARSRCRAGVAARSTRYPPAADPGSQMRILCAGYYL